jgi:Egh16-like virulence factor
VAEYYPVDPAIARNCTGISPCQQDTTIIRDAEISTNIVNECGRTELTGNIDVGENTENALAAGAVTQVKAGTLLTVTIHQVGPTRFL